MLNGNGKLRSVSTTDKCVLERRTVLLGKISASPSGSQAFYLGCPGLKDLDGCPNKLFREPFDLPNILAGVPGPPRWSPKLINQ